MSIWLRRTAARKDARVRIGRRNLGSRSSSDNAMLSQCLRYVKRNTEAAVSLDFDGAHYDTEIGRKFACNFFLRIDLQSTVAQRSVHAASP